MERKARARTGQKHADAFALLVAAVLAAGASQAVHVAAPGGRARARVLDRRAPRASQEKLLHSTARRTPNCTTLDRKAERKSGEEGHAQSRWIGLRQPPPPARPTPPPHPSSSSAASGGQENTHTPYKPRTRRRHSCSLQRTHNPVAVQYSTVHA